MKSIRSNVFETNSSSSHSLTCAKEVLSPTELIPKKYAREGKLPITLKNYGWEYYRYYCFMNKVAYLATQLFNGQDAEYVKAYNVRQSINTGTDGLSILHKAVYNLTGCEVYYPQESDFSIDHESVGNGTELCLDIKKLEDFLLNEASYFETGNDNSEAPWVIGTDKGMMDYYSQHYGPVNKEWPLLSFRKAEFEASLGGKVTLFGKNKVVLGPIQGKDVLNKIISHGVVESILKKSAKDESKYGSMDSRKGEAAKDILCSLANDPVDGEEVSIKISPDLEYQEISDNSVERWRSQLHFQVRVPPDVYREFDALEPTDLKTLELDYYKDQIQRCKESLDHILSSGTPQSNVDYYSNSIRSFEEKIKELESK